MIRNKRILLVISGGIAAYKSLELIRLVRKSGGIVKTILTHGGEKFVTPISISALSDGAVYSDLWALEDEMKMGHIRLSRESDIVVVAPASADIIAKMACGLAGELATAMLLACNKPVIICPAMNPQMWENPATQQNIEVLKKRGVMVLSPESGDMACSEVGVGRMVEPAKILGEIDAFFNRGKPLAGMSALVTSGETVEPIDPVRYIGNRSSGKQGHAIARVLADFGAGVRLVAGNVKVSDPGGVDVVHVETAEEMLTACEEALPVDIGVFVAAVADWGVKNYSDAKIKKEGEGGSCPPPVIELKENPDILATVSSMGEGKRPRLVVGFAAETENLLENARNKLKKKKCDWILANDVGTGKDGKSVFGSDDNHVYLVSAEGVEELAKGSKYLIAEMLAGKVVEYFKGDSFRKGKDRQNV